MKRRCLSEKVLLALKNQFLNHLLFPLGSLIIQLLLYFLKKIFYSLWHEYGAKQLSPLWGSAHCFLV